MNTKKNTFFTPYNIAIIGLIITVIILIIFLVMGLNCKQTKRVLQNSMTEFFTTLIKKDSSFVFVKLGDGEFAAVKGHHGTNCDNDSYTSKLKNGLIEAIQYFSHNNTYCGCWHTSNVSSYFNSIVSGKINWINYHTCLMDSDSFDNDHKFNLFKSIKESKRKKILVGNELLVKAQYLLNIDKHLIIPYKNWVENEFDNILNTIVQYFKNDEKPLILMCAGMGSKILIMHLHKKFPNSIIIDIGSGLDYLCTKKCSRGNSYSYEKLEKYFEEILPSNWNDSMFDYIYELAKNNIGIHIPK